MIKVQNNAEYYLYWIHRKNQKDLKTEGYIGVTFNTKRRFIQHRSNAKRHHQNHIYKALRKYDDIEFSVICVGSMDYILDIEQKLRPFENIGWNIAQGGSETGLGYTKKKGSIKKQAEKMIRVDRLSFLNILVDYFEKGILRKDICKKYNIGQWSVWSIITGNSKAYGDLEEARLALKENRVFNSAHCGSLSEDLYNDILNLRESGRTYIELEELFQIPSRTIREYCKGRLKYLKKFSCYRVLK